MPVPVTAVSEAVGVKPLAVVLVLLKAGLVMILLASLLVTMGRAVLSAPKYPNTPPVPLT